MGAPKGVPRKFLSPEVKAGILSLHEDGLNNKQIAERLCCARHTVGKHLQEHGIRASRPPELVKPAPAERRCECGCGMKLSSKRAAARFISGHQWRKSKGALHAREAALEEPMSGRCGRCQWHVSGPARVIIKAYKEHRDVCPATESLAAA